MEVSDLKNDLKNDLKFIADNHILIIEMLSKIATKIDDVELKIENVESKLDELKK